MRLGLGISIPGTSGLVQPAFSPLDLSPALWLDASDTSTITEVGGAVSQWDDKSGNGNDVTQGTAANQPTSGTRTINGLNVLDFDGSDKLLAAAAATWNFLHQTESVVFIVMETDEAETGYQVLKSTSAVSSTQIGMAIIQDDVGATEDMLEHWIWRGVSATYVVQNDSGNDVFLDGVPGIVRVVADPTNVTAASRSAIHVDGGTAITNNSRTGAVSASDASAPLSIGETSSGVDGAIAELIIVDGTLTAGEIADTESYLANKWGITI